MIVWWGVNSFSNDFLSDLASKRVITPKKVIIVPKRVLAPILTFKPPNRLSLVIRPTKFCMSM